MKLGDLFQRMRANLRGLPPKLGAEAVRHSLDHFDNEAFEGDRWEPRKDKDEGRRLLVKTGRLRRSIRYEVRGPLIIVGTDVPYAQAHNEGVDEEVAVRAHTRRRKRGSARVREYRRHQKLPKRQFLGVSPQLRDRLVGLALRTLFK